jgi:hypothetical protein
MVSSVRVPIVAPWLQRRMPVLPIAFVFAVVALQAGVTWWLWRDPIYLKAEKIAQTKLIWLLPLLGATMVGSMLFDEVRHQKNEKK